MLERLEQWQPLLLTLGGVSALMAIATLVCLPYVITRLPPDYFLRTKRSTARDPNERSAAAVSLIFLKNSGGGLLVFLGVIMLVTPGQGVLTILAGLMLMNFPGKYRLERWLVLRPGVLAGLNWLRGLRGKAPFASPQ
ncbi:MAG: PGPGW domain-containing protein [Halioglobus sp.]